MIKVFRYKKSKGEKNYKKSGEVSKYLGTIKDWQFINNARKFRDNPKDYEFKSSYRDFGHTYIRTVKSKKTGLSWKTIVKEI